MDFGPYLMLASLEGAVLAAVLSLTALGLSLVFGLMDVLNFGHSAFVSFGAFVAASTLAYFGGWLGSGRPVSLMTVPPTADSSIVS